VNSSSIVGWMVVVGLAALAGCGVPVKPGQARVVAQPVERANVLFADGSVRTQWVRKGAQPLSPPYRPEHADRVALPAVVKANNTFAVDLYRELRSKPGNILVSPASLTVGLGMLRAGARSETAAEIDRVLHRPGAIRDLALAALIQDLNADGEKQSYQIRSADAAWVQQEYPLLDAYRTTLRDVFALDDDRQVDFTSHPAEAARSINACVSDRTGGKIREILRPEDVTAPTKLVLTSALYFRAGWTERFDSPSTREAEFHVTRSQSVTVPMMHLQSYRSVHGFLDAVSFRVLSLSCGQGVYAMDVLLPRDVEGLHDLEATLTPEMLDASGPS
jgi:serpin B